MKQYREDQFKNIMNLSYATHMFTHFINLKYDNGIKKTFFVELLSSLKRKKKQSIRSTFFRTKFLLKMKNWR